MAQARWEVRLLGILAIVLGGEAAAAAQQWYLPSADEQKPAAAKTERAHHVASLQLSTMSYTGFDEVGEQVTRAHYDYGATDRSGGPDYSVGLTLGIGSLGGLRFYELGGTLNPFGGVRVSTSKGGMLSVTTPRLSARLMFVADDTQYAGVEVGVTGLRYCRCGVGKERAVTVELQFPMLGLVNQLGEPDVELDLSGVGWGGSLAAGYAW